MSCLQRFVEPFRHEHQEASHPIQRVSSVDFRLCYDGLRFSSTGKRWYNLVFNGDTVSENRENEEKEGLKPPS